MKNIGKPCAGKPHARFDEGGQAQACSLLCPFVLVTPLPPRVAKPMSSRDRTPPSHEPPGEQQARGQQRPGRGLGDRCDCRFKVRRHFDVQSPRPSTNTQRCTQILKSTGLEKSAFEMAVDGVEHRSGQRSKAISLSRTGTKNTIETAGSEGPIYLRDGTIEFEDSDLDVIADEHGKQSANLLKSTRLQQRHIVGLH